MNDEQVNRLRDAIGSHGDQLGGNLVHLKRFLAKQQEDQQKFLSEQRAASESSQRSANRAAMFSAVAAALVATAAIVQAYVAITDRPELQASADAEGRSLSSSDGDASSLK